MGDRVGRNEPCPCGSGLKYKHCCAGKTIAEDEPVSSQIQWVVLLLLVIAGAVVGIRELSSGVEKPRRVWSEAHGHWHVEGQGEEGVVEAAPVPIPPPGPAPPGKEWSPEHGHWHDVVDDPPP